MEKCKYCESTYDEIIENGFVGCEHCYQEIAELRTAIDKIFKGKRHKGRGIRRRYGKF